MSQTLSEWLIEAMPETADYSDVANLCIDLFCSVENLPGIFRDTICTKEYLAAAFADLTRRRFSPEFGYVLAAEYGAGFHSPNDAGHWLEVMASTFKMGRLPDHPKAANLVQSMRDRSMKQE